MDRLKEYFKKNKIDIIELVAILLFLLFIYRGDYMKVYDSLDYKKFLFESLLKIGIDPIKWVKIFSWIMLGKILYFSLLKEKIDLYIKEKTNRKILNFSDLIWQLILIILMILVLIDSFSK